jgi:hypothetical protein
MVSLPSSPQPMESGRPDPPVPARLAPGRPHFSAGARVRARGSDYLPTRLSGQRSGGVGRTFLAIVGRPGMNAGRSPQQLEHVTRHTTDRLPSCWQLATATWHNAWNDDEVRHNVPISAQRGSGAQQEWQVHPRRSAWRVRAGESASRLTRVYFEGTTGLVRETTLIAAEVWQPAVQ